MASVNLTGAPYFKAIDPSKEYSAPLFVSDRPVAQRDLNVLESTISHYMQNLGDGVFKEGDIVSGVDFQINGTANGYTLTFSSGMIYVGGKVREYQGGTASITGVGNETINVSIDREIITSDEDSSLLDPTLGVASSSAKTIDMLKEHVSLVANDATVPTVFKFQDGKLLVQNNQGGASVIQDMLAQRTQDINGTFKTSGYGLSIDTVTSKQLATASTPQVSVIVGEGLAYVNGHRTSKPASGRINLDAPTDVRNVPTEVHTYYNSLGYVKLINATVNVINSVSAQHTVVSKSITHTAGVNDDVGYTNVLALSKVQTAATKAASTSTNTVYAQMGVDFNITNDGKVSWITGSSYAPQSGETYTANVSYQAILSNGTDYKVVKDSSDLDAYGVPAYKLQFSGMSSSQKTPDNLSVVNISYSYFLARRDVIYLKADGTFGYIKGQPDDASAVTAPVMNDSTSLSLGWVTLLPNTDTFGTVNSFAVTNLTFSKLQRLETRVSTLESSVVSLAESIGSIAGADPSALSGVITDSFVDFDMFDPSLLVTDDTLLPKEANTTLLPVALNLDNTAISLREKDPKSHAQSIDSATTPSGYNPMNSFSNGVITSPYVEYTAVSQPVASETVNVNPYMVFGDRLGVMTLNPPYADLSSTKNVTINNTVTSTLNVSRYWAHSASYNNDNKTVTDDAQFVYENQNAIKWDGKNNVNSHDKSTSTGTLTKNAGTITLENAVTTIPSATIQFSVTGLRAFADNLSIKFNGIALATSPAGTTGSGTNKNTIKADANGNASGSFVIPDGQPSGTAQVMLTNTGSGADSTSTAIASYVAKGTETTIQDIIQTTHLTVNFQDPLAQSFQVDPFLDRTVTGFQVFFSKKDSSVPIAARIVTVSDSGFPTQEVVKEKMLYPSDIQTSDDSSVATTIKFDSPLFVTAGKTYAIVLITDSANYEVFSGTVGARRIDNGELIQTQPNLGVMFQSSNAQTWTPMQQTDLKFNIIGARYDASVDATVTFTSITSMTAQSVAALAVQLVPGATSIGDATPSISWSIRYLTASQVASGATDITKQSWTPIASAQAIANSSETIAVVQLKASLRPSLYMSPVFSLKNLTLVEMNQELTGTYMTRGISVDGLTFNTLYLKYTSAESQNLDGANATKVLPKIWFGGTSSNSYSGSDRQWYTIDDSTKYGQSNGTTGKFELTDTTSGAVVDWDSSSLSTENATNQTRTHIIKIKLPTAVTVTSNDITSAGGVKTTATGKTNTIAFRLDLKSSTPLYTPMVTDYTLVLSDEA